MNKQDEDLMDNSNIPPTWYVESAKKMRRNFDTLRNEYINYQKYHQSQKKKWYDEILSKRKELENLGIQFDKETEELKALRVEVFQEKAMKEQLKNDLKVADSFRLKYANIQEEHDGLKFEIEQMRDHHSREIDQLKRQYEEKIEDLQDEKNIFMSQNPRTKDSNFMSYSKLEDEIKGLTLKLNGAKSRQDEQMKEIEELRNEKLNQIREHEDEVNTLHKKLENSVKENRQLNVQLSRMKIQSDSLYSQNKELSEENEQFQMTSLEQQTKISELGRIVEAEQHKHVFSKKKLEMDHARSVRDKDTEIEQLAGKLKLIQKDHDSQQSQVEDLEFQLRSMEEKYEEKYTTLMQKEFSTMSKLKQTLEEYKSKYEDSERLLQERQRIWDGEKDRLKKSQEEQRMQLSDRDEEIRRISVRMEQMEGIIMKMKHERMSVEEQSNEWRKKESTWRIEKEKMMEISAISKQKIEKLKVSIDYKEREQMDLLRKLETWRKEKDGIHKQGGAKTTKLESKIRQLRGQRNKLNVTLEKEKKKARKKIKTLQRMFQDKTRMYEHQVSETKRKEDNLYHQISMLQQTNSKLKRENERAYQLNGLMDGSATLIPPIGNMTQQPNLLNQSQNISMNNQDILRDIESLNKDVNNFLLM